jgi:hypothetical protein
MRVRAAAARSRSQRAVLWSATDPRRVVGDGTDGDAPTSILGRRVKAQELLADVNRSEIVFPEASSTAILSFLNMRDGGAVGSLVCSGVVVFAYHTLSESSLPHYVGEVNHARVLSHEVPTLLAGLRYGWRGGAAVTPEGGELQHVHIEGWVVIDIVCDGVRLVP